MPRHAGRDLQGGPRLHEGARRHALGDEQDEAGAGQAEPGQPRQPRQSGLQEAVGAGVSGEPVPQHVPRLLSKHVQ